MQKILNPELTVAVGVYNAEKYIHQCMDSLLGQTFTDYEILLVESESPDRCAQICAEYAEKYPFIRFIQCENSGDTANPRNTAIEHARGRYITFIDADDLVDSEMYATMVGCMKEKNLDAVYCTCYRFFNDDLATKSTRNIREVFCEDRNQIIEDMILPLMSNLEPGFEVTGSMCMAVYRTDIIKENNLQVIQPKFVFNEDNFFNIQYLARCERAQTLNRPFYFYRRNMASITNTIYEHTIPAMKRFADEAAVVAKGLGVSDEEISLRNKTRFMVSFSAVVRKVFDQMPRRKAIDYIVKKVKDNNIDLSYTKKELACVEMQVKMFWVLMRYRLYTPLYLLVKLYSKIIAR